MPSESAERFALALPGVWLRANQGSFTHLGGRPAGPANRSWARKLLKSGWDVTDEASLRKSCDWLATEGGSAKYREHLAVWRATPAEQREDDRWGRLFAEHADRVGDAAMAAWDHGRRINVAGWGFLAGYLTEEQAWELILPSARICQKHYRSWEDFGDQYVLGKEFWTAADLSADRAAADFVCRDPASPWASIPWNTPLGAAASSAGAGDDAGGGGGMMWVLAAAGAALFGLVCLGGVGIVGVGGAAMFVGRSVSATQEQVLRDAQSGSEPAPTQSAGSASDWDGSAPLLCEGAKKLRVEGVTARFSEGAAITTKGACQLTLVDSHIEAPIAIHSEGASKVFVTGGSLVGSQHAVEAVASAKVTLTGTRVEGKLTKKAAAAITSN